METNIFFFGATVSYRSETHDWIKLILQHRSQALISASEYRLTRALDRLTLFHVNTYDEHS
jgi:hypothetical protein